MSVANLFVCGVYENGKTYSAGRLVTDTDQELYSFCGPTPPAWRRARNIGALLSATLNGLEAACRYRVPAVTIHHPYEGIAAWAKGNWRAKKDFTRRYVKEVRDFDSLVAIKFNLVSAEEPTHLQLKRQCLEAINPKPVEQPYYLRPFPKVDLAAAKEMLDKVYCPRCGSVQGAEPREMRHTPIQLLCPDCHHTIPNHQKLSYSCWRDCVNPSCEAKQALRPYIMIGEAQPMFSLHCPFCFTTYPYQLLSEYWVRLWIEKADPLVRELGDEAVEAAFYELLAAKRRYEEDEQNKTM